MRTILFTILLAGISFAQSVGVTGSATPVAGQTAVFAPLTLTPSTPWNITPTCTQVAFGPSATAMAGHKWNCTVTSDKAVPVGGSFTISIQAQPAGISGTVTVNPFPLTLTPTNNMLSGGASGTFTITGS